MYLRTTSNLKVRILVIQESPDMLHSMQLKIGKKVLKRLEESGLSEQEINSRKLVTNREGNSRIEIDFIPGSDAELILQQLL